jgi:hypothetical protein
MLIAGLTFFFTSLADEVTRTHTRCLPVQLHLNYMSCHQNSQKREQLQEIKESSDRIKRNTKIIRKATNF